MSARRPREDDDDGVFDDDSDDDEEQQEKQQQVKRPPKKKKKVDRSFFDDAAEESGEEGGDDDDDDDDDDEDNNDYVKDDFVVGEEDEEVKKKKGDLDDSDEDDDDDSDDGSPRRKGKLKKVSKMRDRLLDDDLDLVREARGETVVDRQAERLAAEEAAARKEEIRARNADELQEGLFRDSGDEGEPTEERTSKKPKFRRPQGDLYDEEGLDDFIEDDIGDQGDIMRSDRRDYEDGDNRVSEAQLHEASEIFGTDYLEFMGGAQDEEEEELMGKREGINYGYEESEEDEISDDDDIFGDDEGGEGSAQKAEAIKLRREQKRLEKAERRQKQQQERAKKRKEALRRVFEPVQLVENFCTDRDDEIRATDVPERLFDDMEHLANPNAPKTDDPITDEERAHAMWMVNRIPDIKAEYNSAEPYVQETIIDSIVYAFRFMREPQYLEPPFIKRYRRDYVTSNAVKENLYTLFDEDKEFKRIAAGRAKVAELIKTITNEAEGDKSKGADSNRITDLKKSLEAAKRQLDDNEAEITTVKAELDALSNDEEDDDELFGDDNDKEEVRIAF